MQQIYHEQVTDKKIRSQVNQSAHGESLTRDSFSLLCAIMGDLDCHGTLLCSSSQRVNVYLDLSVCALIAVVSTWHTARIGALHFTEALLICGQRIGISGRGSASTLLAAATSFPVLVTSTISTFLFVSNAAVAVVVGTCVYNLQVCVGLCVCILGSQLGALSKLAYARDTLLYICSVGMLLVFLIDSRVDFSETVVLILFYLVYCLVAVITERNAAALESSNGMTDVKSDFKLTQGASIATITTVDSESKCEAGSARRKALDPISFVVDLTFPCTDKHPWVAMILSMTYLLVFTYLMNDSFSRVGTLLAIPSSIMNMVILPICTNLPSTVGGYISAKKEFSIDMAVCSSFGSNIFSVLIGCGLPWLLRLIAGNTVYLQGVSEDLLFFALLLSVHIVVFSLLVMMWKFTLPKISGYIMGTLYLVFVVLVIVLPF
jgi:Ca2+/Na+ antiporter